MMKKVICVFAVLFLLSGVQAYGEQAEGEILVWLRDGEKMITDGSLEIYKAGDPVPEGYLLGPEFGGGIIAGEDVLSGDFALWMAEKAGPGIIGIPDGNGMIWFDGLEPGMYLIRQGRCPEGYEPVDPYLACINEELSRVDTYPKLRKLARPPKTSQSSQVYLGVLGTVIALTGLLYCRDLKKQGENI